MLFPLFEKSPFEKKARERAAVIAAEELSDVRRGRERRVSFGSVCASGGQLQTLSERERRPLRRRNSLLCGARPRLAVTVTVPVAAPRRRNQRFGILFGKKGLGRGSTKKKCFLSERRGCSFETKALFCVPLDDDDL